MPSRDTEAPDRYSDPSIVGSENRVEMLVAELSQVIRAAEPERRAGLKELAETLLHEEMASLTESAPRVEAGQRRNSSNPLLAGLLLLVVGLGLLVIIPLIGITLALIGVVLAALGVFMSWFRK